MNTTNTLIETIARLLQEEGFDIKTLAASDGSVTLDGRNNGTGVVFHLAPQAANTVPHRRTEFGCALPAPKAEQALVIPTVPGFQEMIRRDLDEAAALLGMETGVLKRVQALSQMC